MSLNKKAKPMGGNKGRLPDPLVPLGREQFHDAVMERAGFKCVLCGEPAKDAHHVLDRKLWTDGTQGLMLGNGAAVCHDCHLLCEMTTVSVQAVRLAAGIEVFPLPECLHGLDATMEYDKWGNRMLSDGTRLWGPLHNEGTEKVLRRGGVLHLFRVNAVD